MEGTSIWQSIIYDIYRDLDVDPMNMGRLSEKYVALLVEKQFFHPIAKQDVYQILKDLLYAFIATDNRPQQDVPRRVLTGSQGRCGLPEGPDPKWVPDGLREADLQMAASSVPIRFQKRQEDVRGPVGIYGGQQKEQGQSTAKSGANGSVSGRALRGLQQGQPQAKRLHLWTRRTLRSLSVLRTDHPHVSTERR